MDIYLKEGRDSPCANCTSFVCAANETNVLRIFQDNLRCISFQRNVETDHNTCPGLSIENKTTDPDPTNAALSIFVVEGKQCVNERKSMVEIVCVDAMFNSEALIISKSKTLSNVSIIHKLLQYTGKKCNPSCYEFNCSGCIRRNMAVNKWCQGFENFTTNVTKVNVLQEHIHLELKYCTCEENATDSVVLTGSDACGDIIVIMILASCEVVSENGKFLLLYIAKHLQCTVVLL